MIKGLPSGKGYYGFAIEIFEPDRKTGTEDFINAAARIKIDIDKAATGIVSFSGVTGRNVMLRYGRSIEEIEIWRESIKRDWNSAVEMVLYGNADGAPNPVLEQEWGDGTLTVRAGGSVFTSTVTRDGKVSFAETKDR